jgi:hypothetical protein
MRIHLGAACATIAILAGMMGCGSYSAPDDSGNPPTAPDSTGDSTPAPPPPGYLQR